MRWKSRLAPVLLAVAAFAGTAAIDPNRYLEDIRFLTSKELKGRGTGTPELDQAAHFLAAKYREFGLQPAAGQSYYQDFPVTASAHLGPHNRFVVSEHGARTELRFPEEFVPYNFSAAGKLAGSLVFAGYGITAPEYGYDDYAGLDAAGKVVVILRHEPQEYDEKSIFAGRVYTQHAQYFTKAANARAHGAAGVILLLDRANHRNDRDEMEKFATSAGPMDAGSPFVQVETARADRWFAAAGKDLDEIEAAIDQDLKPRSFAFPDTLRVDASVDVERAVKTVHNVEAYLPGETGEYVVIGAHYDHLGLGEQFSLAPSQVGTVHPGADDNASGTAGVIELARWFAMQPHQRRGILFLSFAGEELGMLGSGYYVSHPVLPLENAVAMINLDMIGRLRDGKVYVGGVTSGDSLRETLDRVAPQHALHVDYGDGTGYGSSDHTSFATRQIPTLFFFTGLHGDYHTPGDTWDKIDAPGAVRLLQMVAAVADSLRQGAARPRFVRAGLVRSGTAGAQFAAKRPI